MQVLCVSCKYLFFILFLSSPFLSSCLLALYVYGEARRGGLNVEGAALSEVSEHFLSRL